VLFAVVTDNTYQLPIQCLLAAVSTASGAIQWPTISYLQDSSFYAPFNVTLPVLTSSGNLCVAQGSGVKCFSASTGEERYSIPASSGAVGLDPSRSFLVITSTNETTTLVKCFAASSGTLIWQSVTPSGAKIVTAELSLSTLYAVVSDEARNSASLYAWSLTDGRTPAGLPSVLPSSDYRGAQDISITPSGALLITRFSSADKGGVSLALVDAGSGDQKWVATPPGFPYPGAPVVLSADGALAYAAGICTTIIDNNPTCTSGAILAAVNLATGKLVTVAQPDAFVILPVAPDRATGGVVAIFIKSYTGTGGSVGVASSGAVAWLTPAQIVGAHAPTRRVALRTDPSLPSPTLSLATLPSPAAPASAALSTALIGGLAGGAGALAVAAAAAAAFVNRAALAALIQRARGGGEASALLG
jgi:outer membrane protein assembly factor BamB